MIKYSGKQFSIFRILMGIWLVFYFSSFIPYAEFYFGEHGAFPSKLSWAFLPNIFQFLNTPFQAKAVLIILIIFSLFFIIGLFRRTSSLILWFGWASIVGRFPFIFTPIDGYVGWFLLALAIIPPGDPLSIRPANNWKMPREIYWGAYFIIALSYSFSGYIKLSSSSWLDGNTLFLVFNGPLVRPWASFLGDFPKWFLSFGTWLALAGELLFFPLFLIKPLRPYLWWGASLFHFSIFLLIGLGDLSLFMLITQIFLLNPKWLPRFKPVRASLSSSI